MRIGITEIKRPAVGKEVEPVVKASGQEKKVVTKTPKRKRGVHSMMLTYSPGLRILFRVRSIIYKLLNPEL